MYIHFYCVSLNRDDLKCVMIKTKKLERHPASNFSQENSSVKGTKV